VLNNPIICACHSREGGNPEMPRYDLTIANAVLSSDKLSCRGWPGCHLLSLLRQRKKAKKGDAEAVARCAGSQVKQSSVGSTNKLAFGSNRFALFIRLTIACLGNVTCG